MRLLRKPTVVFSLLVLALMLVLLPASLRYAPHARMAPLFVIVFVLILTLLVFLGEVFPRLGAHLRKSIYDTYITAEVQKRAGSEAESRKARRDTVIVFGWIVCFLVSIFFIGLVVSMLLWIFVFLKFARSMSWPKSLAVSIAVPGLVYLVFVVILRFRLFEGLLFGAHI